MFASEELRQDCLAIHTALHSVAMAATIRKQQYPIVIRHGCRSLLYRNITFMIQNKYKRSVYAERARNGETITWGIQQGGWILIDGNGVHFPNRPAIVSVRTPSYKALTR